MDKHHDTPVPAVLPTEESATIYVYCAKVPVLPPGGNSGTRARQQFESFMRGPAAGRAPVSIRTVRHGEIVP